MTLQQMLAVPLAKGMQAGQHYAHLALQLCSMRLLYDGNCSIPSMQVKLSMLRVQHSKSSIAHVI